MTTRLDGKIGLVTGGTSARASDGAGARLGLKHIVSRR
jgi:hypothetical protein